MKMKSHYGDLAINLLSGQTEHSQHDTLSTANCMTNSTGEKQPPTPFIHSTKGSPKAVQNRQQNGCKKTAYRLSREICFYGCFTGYFSISTADEFWVFSNADFGMF